MPSTSIPPLDLMEHLAIVRARRQRDQYLRALDTLLATLSDGAPASLEESRRLFATYEPPHMPSLRAEIEAMREER